MLEDSEALRPRPESVVISLRLSLTSNMQAQSACTSGGLSSGCADSAARAV